MANFTRLLCIDGGGIRGIIPGMVIVSVEKKLQELTGNPEARIADYFDLIAGTSTGGILACVYLLPDVAGDPTRPRFSAQDAVDLYLDRGDDIFDISFWHRARTAGGLLDEKYSAESLEETLDDYCGDLKLSDLLKPCLITTYDIRRRQAKFLTQHDAVADPKHDFYVKDAARATSAAPTYFEVARIKSMTQVPYPLIDGGIFASNPALCAYAEARHALGNQPTARDMAILSIGTGYVKKQYDYRTAKDWGLVEWARPAIDMLMSGVSETVNYQLTQIFEAVGHPQQYLRVDGEIEYAAPDMDDASGENLRALQREGDRIAREFDAKLSDFVQLLIQ